MGTTFAGAVDEDRHAVEAVLQNRMHAGVGGAVDLQRTLASGADPFAAVLLDQAFEAHARPVAMLGMRPRRQDGVDQLGHRWSDAGAPGHQLGRRPLQVRSVGGGHVLWLGEKPTPTVLAHVAGRPVDCDGGSRPRGPWRAPRPVHGPTGRAPSSSAYRTPRDNRCSLWPTSTRRARSAWSAAAAAHRVRAPRTARGARWAGRGTDDH